MNTKEHIISNILRDEAFGLIESRSLEQIKFLYRHPFNNMMIFLCRGGTSDNIQVTDPVLAYVLQIKMYVLNTIEEITRNYQCEALCLGMQSDNSGKI